VQAEVVKYAAGPTPSAAGSMVDDGAGNIWLVRHLTPNTPTFGVIAVDLGRKADGETDDVRRRVDAALEEAAATLDRLDVAQVINEARMRSEAEELREALIGSVSHELRTPLASILGSATVLVNTPTIAEDERLSALADVIRGEAERLNSDIQNLLDATRITTQSLRPRQQWLEPSDIVNAALERRRRRLSGHVIERNVSEDLPLIYADPVLLEQAVVQLLDNAAKYSPSGSTISVAACHESDGIVLSVSDRGAGFTADEREHLGERFFRGQRHISSIPGSGLGLWIANAFVTAIGGELTAVSGGAGLGSKVSILLPVVRSGIMQLEGAVDE
jgi:two-component system sensor histidine kinase KdpD